MMILDSVLLHTDVFTSLVFVEHVNHQRLDESGRFTTDCPEKLQNLNKYVMKAKGRPGRAIRGAERCAQSAHNKCCSVLNDTKVRKRLH
eukprot:6487106-Amphidinium_carterae.1